MKVQIICLLILALTEVILCHHFATKTKIVHIDPKNSAVDGGFWSKKVIWKPRLVRQWKEKKYVIGVWKQVWGPVEVKEWIPYPKDTSPGWIPHHHHH